MENELGSLEIYADFLLEKVFFNLVENSLRHGEQVTVSGSRTGTMPMGSPSCTKTMVLAFPATAKDKIFKREYYRNTGYGLFLSQEILSITGLTIKETGEPGKESRFEIHVPTGAFRFPLDSSNS